MTADASKSGAGDEGSALRWGTIEAESFGTLWLVWTPKGLRRLDWALPDELPLALGTPPTEVPAIYRDLLRLYFAGEDADPATLPIDPVGTVFQKNVWHALRRVARGHVRSYAGIATDVGSPRAMRAVGMANAANPIPIVVPCHRIVEADYGIGGYSGGLDRKRFLLRLEGVRVVDDRVMPGQLTLF